MIVIVGAGLAGLTCAKVLREAGHEVMVVEAANEPGGRVRTDQRDGFLLDRGFQVLFTAYPAVRRHLHLPALDLKPFAPGATIAKEGKLYDVTDPFRDHNLGHLATTVANPLISLGDKLRVARLRGDVAKMTVPAIFQDAAPDGDRSTYEELTARGFAPAGFIDQFMRPFYGGIFLNRDLHTSARMFLFTFKMLAEGDTAIPAAGMGAIAEQLASHVPEDRFHFNASVTEILVRDGHAAGVRLESGDEIAGDAVVLATDLLTAQRLAGVDIPSAAQPVPANCVYFASDAGLYAGPKIVLNPDPNANANIVVQLTNIAPSYAPPGQHLISVGVLGAPALDDAKLIERCRANLGRLFPYADVAGLRPLGVYRIPLAQFDQPPDIFPQLPANATPTTGLFLAGEYTESSSIHGAMHSGEKAAKVVLSTL